MAQKRNIIVGLLDQALAHRQNPTLQAFALLRVLLPQLDNRSVYGFKASGLMRSFAKAMEKEGGLSGRMSATQLIGWIRAPSPVESGKYLITKPEVAIARMHNRCFPDKKQGLTLVQAVALCQRLTNTYKERHKQSVLSISGQAGPMSVHIDSVAEVLAGVLGSLSYNECRLLVRLLLRTVPIGVGPKTVQQALGPFLADFLSVQTDLSRLATSLVTSPHEPHGLLCCVPFTPMTCRVTSSPYLAKFLFSKEDTVRSYLTPKEGRLIIHSTGAWFVPLKGSNSKMRNRYVDLESAAVGVTGARGKHMLIMREVMHSKALMVPEKASGFLLHYMLYLEEGSYVLLLRAAKPLADCDVEYVDVSIIGDNQQKRKKKAELQGMLRPAAGRVALPAYNTTVRAVLEQQQEERVPSKGLLVQRKMDGDRLQAHIMLDTQGRPTVRLFTKRGRPVHGLYTDVAAELEGAMNDQPCILDGEIIVVDQRTGNPLPWCSTKWRYDSGASKSVPLSSLRQKKRVVTVVNGSGGYGYNPGDGEDETDLTFAPDASALMHWGELGASEKERLKAKEMENCSLLFVVFDVLMLKGNPTIGLSCAERFELLKRMPSLNRLKHTKVISESWYVQTAEEVEEKLHYIMKQKGEGLILKDPRAKYQFRRTQHQRKLKVNGPDINCGVVGLGFTQSRNPRMWGLLTCIRSASRLLVYNRVESLEGDSLKTAAEHILALPSLVSLHALLNGSSKEQPLTVGSYTVYATKISPLIFTVTWEGNEQLCTLHFLQGTPKDIQWLCSPFDCQFGLSQRGDVYPVDWEAEALSVMVPRFPVGRIQHDDHQRSEFDTPDSIEAKFNEAANEATCIQGFFTRKINQLRAKPPAAKNLEEMRRILTAKEKPNEPWPQPIPTMYLLKDLSDMLVKNGFEELSAGERMALSGMPTASQWDPLLVRQAQLNNPLPSEMEEEAAQDYETKKPYYIRRFKLLKKKLKLPFLMPCFTGADMQALNCDVLEAGQCVGPVLLSSSEEEEEDGNEDNTLAWNPPWNNHHSPSFYEPDAYGMLGLRREEEYAMAMEEHAMLIAQEQEAARAYYGHY